MPKKSVAKVADAQKASERVHALSDAEWQRRTKLDVSDPQYINPSYDR